MTHTAMVTGEGRFRWLHVKPGHHNDLIDAARGCYGRDAWIHTIEEVETLGWFGGPLTEEGRGRLGDVAVVPHQPVAYLDPADQGDSHLVCRHGSLTDDEMFVPLLAVAV